MTRWKASSCCAPANKAQNVLKGVEAKTKELNNQVLPKDVKIVPFYDRTDLIAVTTNTVAGNLLRGMFLVVVILIFFLYDVRAGLIVADHHSPVAVLRFRLSRPSGRLRQSSFHRRDRLRHIGGCGGGDGGEYLPPDWRCAMASLSTSWT